MINRMIMISSLSFFIFCTFFLPAPSYSQQPPTLEEGVNLYKAEKYDEAITALKKAREEEPQSSTAAFFLGMAYKQTMDYESASGQLTDAVTLTPRIKEALIELIDVSLQLGKIDEAMKWIGVAEVENILPAKTAYLKGLALTEEGKNKEAAASFEKAKSLDPTIAQASDIQIALSHMRDSELKSAKESFQSAITLDPQSDMAGFARQYLARVEETMEAQRAFHVTLSLFGQYDDNMVLKPTDESLATGVTNQASLVMNTGLRASYSPTIKGPWLFNAYYAISSSLHQEHKDTHDSFSHTLSMTPGYNFGKYAINLSATYSYSLVRNPDYERYSGNLSVGPMFRIALSGNQLLEIFGGYADNKYYQPVYAAAENRDSSGLSGYASWVWLFRKNSFLNLRYQYTDQNAKGSNWDNGSNRASANVVIPAGESLKIQVSGEYEQKDFKSVHTTFRVKRQDKIYNASGGLSWAAFKNGSVVVQYTRTGNGSNVGIYDYTRNLYTMGLEYRF